MDEALEKRNNPKFDYVGLAIPFSNLSRLANTFLSQAAWMKLSRSVTTLNSITWV